MVRRLYQPLRERVRAAWRARAEASGFSPRRRRASALWQGLDRLESRVLLSHALTEHIHADLDILIEGNPLVIPANLGVGPGGIISAIHTHAADNELHIHAFDEPLTEVVPLGDLFDTWQNNAGIPGNDPNAIFNQNRIFNNLVDANHELRMFVNGAPNFEFEQFDIHDGDSIAIFYDTIGQGEPITVLSGSPLHTTLDGFGLPGQSVTYTAISDNPQVETFIPEGNRNMRITVTDFGEMVFELFESRAPRVTEHFITLAEDDFFDGIIFHRVINNFVIQGGDPTGTGSGGSPLGDFDDQYHLDLQHTRTGLLSMAKSDDDTNDSQFFITEGPTRHLDSNHSIFGILVEGEAVREAISNVNTGGGDRPDPPVVMESVDIFVDPRNAALMFKAPEGNVSRATVTVSAEDELGNEAERVFDVTVIRDPVNTPPFLEDIPEIRTNVDTQTDFQLTAQDAEGDLDGGTNIFFLDENSLAGNGLAVPLQSHQDLDYAVGITTGLVTVTPTNGLIGIYPVTVATASSPTAVDYQVVPIHIAPLAPDSADLLAISDSGSSAIDNVTTATQLEIQVSGATDNALVKLYSGDQEIGQGVANSDVVITTDVLAPGAHSITATQTVNEVESDPTAALDVVIDDTDPIFTTIAPGDAFVEEEYQYDANTNEDAQAVTFELLNEPAGAVIDANTGFVTWTPTLALLGQQAFEVRATDLAGNTAIQAVDVLVTDLTPGFEPLDSSQPVALTDASGDSVLFSLKGPGSGKVFVPNGGGDATRIELEDTTTASTLTITAKGAVGRTTLEDIIVGDPANPADATSIGKIVASVVDILGDVIITGIINTLTLGDVLEDHNITVRGVDATQTATVTLGRVADAIFTFGIGIKKLTLIEWLDTRDELDMIIAPFIASLKVAGAFQAGMTLSGLFNPRQTLGSVRIDGDLGSGDPQTPAVWDVTGEVSTIDASKGTVEGWRLVVHSNVKSIKLGDVEAADVVVGVAGDGQGVATGDIGTLSAKRWNLGEVRGGTMKSFTVSGDRRTNLSGDYRGSMTLAGPAPGSRARQTLRRASIAGNLGAGAGQDAVVWDLTGASGTIDASKGTVDGWDLVLHSSISSVKLGLVQRANVTIGDTDAQGRRGDVGTLSATQWELGTVVGGTIKSLSIKNDRRVDGADGDFRAAVTLTGPAADSRARQTLAKASITGDLGSGDSQQPLVWQITGDSGTIDASKGQVDGWELQLRSNISNVKLGDVQSAVLRVGLPEVGDGPATGDLRSLTADEWRFGRVEAGTLRSFSVRGNRQKQLAGNFTGTVILDGPAPDSRARQTLGSAKITGDLIDSVINLLAGDSGSFTVSARMTNSQLSSVGDIKSVTVGQITDSQIRAGVDPAVPMDLLPVSADQFNAEPAQLGSFSVRGVRGAPRDAVNFDNSIVTAFMIGRVSLGNVQTDNAANGGDAFGLAAARISGVTGTTEAGVRFPRLSNLETADDIPVGFDFGNLIISLV